MANYPERYSMVELSTKPEFYRVLNIREMLEEVFPQTRGTMVPGVVAGYLDFMRDFARPELTESAASILYAPSEKGFRVVKKASRIISACASSQGLKPEVKDALARISEGPDLDFKTINFEDPFLGFIAEGKPLHPNRFLDRYFRRTGKREYRHSGSGLCLEINDFQIPSYSPENIPGRQILELVFHQNGNFVLRCHLASMPFGRHYPDDCRFGKATFSKPFCLSAPVDYHYSASDLPDPDRLPELISIGLNKGILKLLQGPDGFYYSSPLLTNNSATKPGVINPLVFTVNTLRMINQALLTLDKESILNKKYIDPDSYNEMVCIFGELGEIGRNERFSRSHRGLLSLSTSGERAKLASNETFSLVLLNCLTDGELFSQMVRDINLIHLFHVGKEDFSSVEELLGSISATGDNNTDSGETIRRLNKLADFFTLKQFEARVYQYQDRG